LTVKIYGRGAIESEFIKYKMAKSLKNKKTVKISDKHLDKKVKK